MIYLPVLWLLYYAYRSLSGSGSSYKTEIRDIGGSDWRARPRQSVVDARYLVVWLLGGFTVIVAGVWLTRAPVASALALAVASIFLAPWLFARYVLIPLGLMRASAVFGRLARWNLRHDAGDGAAALAAALALSRKKRRATEGDLARLTARLDAPSQWPMRGATIAAHAVLATVRDDPARALCLFESIELLHPRAAPRIARRLAARYRMAVAAFRGDWVALTERAATYRWLTRSAWCYGALAAWHLGSRGAWSRFKLRLFRVLAPDRRRTGALIAHAIASEAAPAFEAPGGVEPIAWPHAVVAPFDEALRKHAALAMAPDGPGLGEAWRASATAWQKVFEDDAMAERALERGRELGVDDARPLLAVFGSFVRTDLATEAQRPGVNHEDLSKAGPLGAWVVAHLGDQELRDLDYRADALLQRDRAKTSIPIVEDWAEIATIHAKLERSSKRLGALFARTAFDAIHVRVGNHAARIYNLRNEQPIANAAFRWLATYAERVGNESALTLYQKNASIGF